MEIVLLPHAKARMAERKITEKLVYRTLLQPNQVEQDKTGKSRFLAKRKFINSANNKSYMLLVIYETQNNQIQVIAVISTSKIDKYS